MWGAARSGTRVPSAVSGRLGSPRCNMGRGGCKVWLMGVAGCIPQPAVLARNPCLSLHRVLLCEAL